MAVVPSHKEADIVLGQGFKVFAEEGVRIRRHGQGALKPLVVENFPDHAAALLFRMRFRVLKGMEDISLDDTEVKALGVALMQAAQEQKPALDVQVVRRQGLRVGEGGVDDHRVLFRLRDVQVFLQGQPFKVRAVFFS